jgi:hypothetical protein
MIRKRGQSSGSSAATLVAIIAGLIILYILFLEPADREDLLGEGKWHRSNNEGSDDKNITVLLDEKTGRLDYLKDNEFEIDIPSFNLYKTTNAKEIEAFNDFSVRNGWFDKKTAEKSFSISDLENTDNAVLSFVLKRHVGRLSIDLNGNNIFDGFIDTANTEPIKLPKSYLTEGENKLDFNVDGVGAAFWKTNEYSFSNAKVIGDITDVSKQKTKNVFTIEAWKYNNLDKATLKFNPDCKQGEAGILDILVNNENVFSGVPDCGMLNRYEIPTGSLNAGVNDVVFLTNSGSYLIDQIKVDLDLQELSSPLYWFELSAKQIENITNAKWDCNLTIKFVDDDEDKTLDINVNGHMKRIDQQEPMFSYSLNKWIEEGRNYIKLIPKTTVDIVRLKIDLIEKDEED